MASTLAGLLALAGSLLVALGGTGVVRFADIYARMHAATKASTLGIALVGVAAAIVVDAGAAKVFLAVAFIFVTAPCAAHVVGRSAYWAENIPIELHSGDDLAGVIEGTPQPD